MAYDPRNPAGTSSAPAYDYRSGSAAAPATAPKPAGRQPTPEETANAVAGAKANNLQAVWDPVQGRYRFEPLPAGETLRNETTAGTADITADIGRRQTASQGGFSDTAATLAGGSPLNTAGRQVIDPAATLAGSSGVAGRDAFGGGAFSGVGQNTVAPRAAPAVPAGFENAGAPTVVNPSKVEVAADLAKEGLGPAPTIDRGLADRNIAGVQDALGLQKQVVQNALTPIDMQSLDLATADARKVLDGLLNGPSVAERLGAQTLRSQLALARSAAGGPGAVQEALRNAQMQAPELQAQAAQSAIQERQSMLTAAGGVAKGLEDTALGAQQTQTGRITAAATAAAGNTQGNLGSRQQDIDIAKSNQDAATALLGNITQLTGVELQIDQAQQELLGQMARDMAAQDFNWAQLDVGTQEKEFDRWVQVYQIDTTTAAQIKAAAAANKKGPMDYIVPIVGALASLVPG